MKIFAFLYGVSVVLLNPEIPALLEPEPTVSEGREWR